MLPGLMPWSKAGIIIKESLHQGSAYAAMMVTGSNGVRMQYNYTSDTAGLPGNVSAVHPRWLRLTRSGDTITGYDSADGTHWTEVGTARLSGLPATVQVGHVRAPRQATCVAARSFGGAATRAAPARPPGSSTTSRVRASGRQVGRRHGGRWRSGRAASGQRRRTARLHRRLAAPTH